MSKLKCDKCNDPAEVAEPIGYLCYSCWLSIYAQLSRKETQRYGNGPYNRDYARGSISHSLK